MVLTGLVFLIFILVMVPLFLINVQLGDLLIKTDEQSLKVINENQWIFWLAIGLAIVLIVIYFCIDQPQSDYDNLFGIIRFCSTIVIVVETLVLSVLSAIIINKNEIVVQKQLLIWFLIASLIVKLGFLVTSTKQFMIKIVNVMNQINLNKH